MRDAGVKSGAAAATTAAALAASWVVVAGVASYVSASMSRRPFGSIELAPLVVALKITRLWGAWGAACCVCFVLTGILHTASCPRGRP